jgi:hypothetical protein
MQSKQARSSNHQNQVPPTIWHQLPPTSQQQLAHLVAQLIQRVRQAASDKEREHER